MPKPCTRNHYLETIWNAIQSYRETCIPERHSRNDAEWDDITSAMAFMEEDLKADPPITVQSAASFLHNAYTKGDINFTTKSTGTALFLITLEKLSNIAAILEPNPSPVSFGELANANEERQAEWGGGEKIDLAFRGLELAGEVGELCNALKKLVRLQKGIQGTTEISDDLINNIQEELGDVVICTDLIANTVGMDLGESVVLKFNKTSRKHGLKTRM